MFNQWLPSMFWHEWPIECSRDVQSDYSDLVGRVWAAYPRWSEWPGVIPNWWSEMRVLEKWNDFVSTAMMDSMTLLMIGSKLIGLKWRGSVFAPFYVVQWCWWFSKQIKGAKTTRGEATSGSHQTLRNCRPSHTNNFANRPWTPITRPRDLGSSV